MSESNPPIYSYPDEVARKWKEERDEARDLVNALLQLLYSVPPRVTRLIRDHGYNAGPCMLAPELETELNKLGIKSK